MCVAILQVKGAVTLTTEQIKRGWHANPDGGGYAFIHPQTEKIVVRKSLSRLEFVKAYMADHERYGALSPFIVHLRFATHGDPHSNTTHPFSVDTSDGQTVFAHNGIVSPTLTATTATRSDTMVFRDFILNDLPDGWLDNLAIKDLVQEYIGWSRLVFLTTSKSAKHEWYIIGEDTGEWDEQGNWFSNTSCEPAKTYGKTTYGYGVDTFDTWVYDNEKEKYFKQSKKLATRTPWKTTAQSAVAAEARARNAGSEEDNEFCNDCQAAPCTCAVICYVCDLYKAACDCPDFVSIKEVVDMMTTGRYDELEQVIEERVEVVKTTESLKDMSDWLLDHNGIVT